MDSMLSKRLDELENVRQMVCKGVANQENAHPHEFGKLTVRERLNILLDEDSLIEMNPLVGHALNQPADGLICGLGTIYGRQVFVYAQDPTVRGGSIGLDHGYKMYRSVERALELRVPFIGLHDSPGARIPNSNELELWGKAKRTYFSNVSEKHGGSIFFPNTMASGVIPQISAILGTCGGISVYSPALTDFIFMVEKTSHMFITGPDVVKMVTGETISKEDLGGASVHMQKSGCCDFSYSDESECLNYIRYLIGFLPSNSDEMPPEYDNDDDPERSCPELNDIVPASSNKGYDVRQVIRVVVDNGEFLEIKRNFAQEVVVGFGRLDGKTVGIVANQPIVKAGTMTADSSDKQARFIRFCDCFNIPLLFLVDTPAYMPGSDQEHSGIIRHGAKVLYAICEATVPRISLVLRKAYGGGNLGMGVLPGLGNDMILYWPIMEAGILGAEQSVRLLYGKKPEATKDFLDQKLKEYMETFANPIFEISSNLNVQNVITPAETRSYIIKAFKMMPGRKPRAIKKRHGNIPL